MAYSRASWSQKIVQGSLYGFAFFSPWSIAGAQSCLGIGLIAWVVGLFGSRKRQLIFSSLGWPIAAFLGIGLLSALFSPDRAVGLRALMAEWVVLLFFLVINNVDSEKTAGRILDVLILVALLISLYAAWQHWFGWDLYRDRPLRPTGSLFEATGLFGHHLTFGGYMMVLLVVSGCLFLWGAEGRRRIFYALASFLLMLALLFSYARSAWLGLLAGVFTVGLLKGRKILLIGLVGCLFLGLALYQFQPSFHAQIEELLDILQDPMSKSDRVSMWAASLRLIRDHPLLGAGLGQVMRMLPSYGCDLGYSHLHNDLLNTAANAGLLGLAAFLWIWVAFIRTAADCRRCQRQSQWARALAMAGCGLMMAFLVAGLFQCYYTDAEDGMLLWFLMGMVVAVCRIIPKTDGVKKWGMEIKSGAPLSPADGQKGDRKEGA